MSQFWTATYLPSVSGREEQAPTTTKVVSLTKLLNSSHFLFASKKKISLKIFYVNEVMSCILQRNKAKHGVTQIGPDSYYNYSYKKSITYNLALSTNIG